MEVESDFLSKASCINVDERDLTVAFEFEMKFLHSIRYSLS